MIHTLRISTTQVRGKRTFLPILVFCLSLAAVACSSTPPVSEFNLSSGGGTVPHEVQFTPLEESGDVGFLWEFGDGATSTERSPTHTYEDAGNLTVRLTVSKGGSQTISENPVSLEPGEAGWIILEPSGLELESGDRGEFMATAFDTLGNPVPDADFTWAAAESAGTVLDDGTFVAGPQTGEYSQAVTVEFERLGVTASANAPIEIVFGPLDSIVVEPPSIYVRVNNRVDFKVTAQDRQGHVLPEPDIDWEPLRGGVDAVLAGGEFRAGALPTRAEQDLAKVSVTVGGKTLTQTISGAIASGILDRVEVTSSASQITVGSTVSFTAEGFDRFGNTLELDSVEWQLLSEDFGEVTEDGVFTPAGSAASATGPLMVAVAEVDRVRSQADIELEVLPGNAVRLSLVPVADSIPVGAGNPLVAFAFDEFDNVIDGIEVKWTANSGGAITDAGVFIAGFETGEFLGAVTATIEAGAAGNASPLTASADMVVRDRSSDTLAVEITGDSDAGILFIDLTTAQLMPVSDELDTNDGVELTPAWWPDGSRLAYSSDITGIFQIYDIEIETGKIRQLVDEPAGSAMPAISPDGARIAFVITTGSNWQLYVADLPVPDAEGNIVPVTLEQATKLSVEDEVQSVLPYWSPDGSAILFTISRSVSEVDMSIVAADGSSPPRQIGESGLSASGWSNDGDFILAIDNANTDDQSLLVLDSETGEPAGVIPVPFQSFLAAWAPDTSEAAVIDRFAGALWLVDVDGTSLRQALGSDFVPRRVAWRPVPIDAEAILAERANP